MVAACPPGTRLPLAKALPDPATRAEVLAAIRPYEPPRRQSSLVSDSVRPAAATRARHPARSHPRERPRPRRLRSRLDPWAFLNGDAHTRRLRRRSIAHCARALRWGVRLEHVSLNREHFADALASGAIDVGDVGPSRQPARRGAFGLLAGPTPRRRSPFSRSTTGEASSRHVREPARAARCRIAILEAPRVDRGAVCARCRSPEVVTVSSPLEFAGGAGASRRLPDVVGARLRLEPASTRSSRPRSRRRPLGRFSPRLRRAAAASPELLNVVDTFVDVERANGRFEDARATGSWASPRAQQPRGRSRATCSAGGSENP